MSDYTAITFHVPPSQRWLMSQLSYGQDPAEGDDREIIVRCCDSSDGSVTYERACLADGEVFEPWNFTPALRDCSECSWQAPTCAVCEHEA
jgi:hypothetical protein